MIPIPEMKVVDIAFGNIDHMPKYEDVPKEFKDMNNKWCAFISKWFFCGIPKEIYDALEPKEGVDKEKAINAIRAILGSFAPKHEHKEAACAYLMSEWFEYKEELNAWEPSLKEFMTKKERSLS
jgi:hypothetical protein